MLSFQVATIEVVVFIGCEWDWRKYEKLWKGNYHCWHVHIYNFFYFVQKFNSSCYYWGLEKWDLDEYEVSNWASPLAEVIHTMMMIRILILVRERFNNKTKYIILGGRVLAKKSFLSFNVDMQNQIWIMLEQARKLDRYKSWNYQWPTHSLTHWHG